METGSIDALMRTPLINVRLVNPVNLQSDKKEKKGGGALYRVLYAPFTSRFTTTHKGWGEFIRGIHRSREPSPVLQGVIKKSLFLDCICLNVSQCAENVKKEKKIQAQICLRVCVCLPLVYFRQTTKKRRKLSRLLMKSQLCFLGFVLLLFRKRRERIFCQSNALMLQSDRARLLSV